MADVKISLLPAADPVDGSEVFPIVQGATTKKVSLSDAIAAIALDKTTYDPGNIGAPIAFALITQTVNQAQAGVPAFSYDNYPTGTFFKVTTLGVTPLPSSISYILTHLVDSAGHKTLARNCTAYFANGTSIETAYDIGANAISNYNVTAYSTTFENSVSGEMKFKTDETHMEIVGGDVKLGYPESSKYLQITEQNIHYYSQGEEDSQFSIEGSEIISLGVGTTADGDYYKPLDIPNKFDIYIGDRGGVLAGTYIHVSTKASDNYVDIVLNGGKLKIDGVECVSGTFTSLDGKTVTVTNGLITSIKL